MRQPLNVSTKIWLSLSVLIASYFISIIIGFYLGRQTEYRLYRVSQYVYPAAKYSQTALTEFDDQIERYREAVLIGEQSSLELADKKAVQVDDALLQITGLKGLDAEKINKAISIHNLFKVFVETARQFYPRLMEEMSLNGDRMNLPQDIIKKANRLSREKEVLKLELSLLADSFSNELNAELASIRSISVHQRFINLIVFIVVLLLAASFTSLIINRSIVRPLGRTLMLEKAIEQSLDGIIVADAAGEIQFINQAWADMHGYKPEELAGKNISCFHTKDQFQREFVPFNNESKLKGSHSSEVGHRGKGGATFPTMMTASIIKDKTKSPLRLIYVARDISEQKHHEEELREAKEIAELATRTKSSFLANMSHEIRTPMNGIIGMTSLLMNTSLSREQRESAEIIQQSADSLLCIIEDILDFSKIEAGKLTIEKINFDVVQTIESAGEPLALKAHQKQLDLFYNIDPDIPIYLKGDPHRLKQILVNLVGNAIKFTRQGEITIRVETASETDTQACLKFTISDTGIGIPGNHLDRLFKPFSQIDASTTREFGGTGLGLIISKEIVGLMDGEIGVESREGKGSTFWFTAVFEKQAGGKIRQETIPDSLYKKKILVVSDNDREADLMAKYLSSWGCRYQTAADARTAVSALILAAEADDPFHLAIIDHAVAKDDDVPIDRAVKADPLISGTGLILITGYVNHGRKESEQNNYTACLTKPIKRSQLFNCLVAFLNNFHEQHYPDARSREAASFFSGLTNHSSHRILIVEDNPVNQLLAARVLAKIGFQLDIANNGLEAIQALKTTAYDVVLMDAQMPKMDGIEATAIIRDPASEVINHQVPIIAMTAHAMKGDRERFITAGMNDYVAKPFRLEELYSVIAKHISTPEKPAV